jgi:prepilin-type N-terminal cleavage/methylation domain-containing protein
MSPSRLRIGFTLIELLIVVAIIAILAAIAVPNFLEAQTRSKVSRTLADMRTMATGIEAYYVDHNNYIPIIAPNATGFNVNGRSVFFPGVNGISSRFIRLTTPISYLTSVFPDPFIPSSLKFAKAPLGETRLADYDTFDYVDAKSFSPEGKLSGGAGWSGAAITSGAMWRLSGCGPDTRQAWGGGPTSGARVVPTTVMGLGVDYDPTNGTISNGDIVRVGGGPGRINGNILPSTDRATGLKYNF